MITKSDIINVAHEHGFEDVGFTTADPFPDHKQLLLDRHKEYEWAEAAGLKLLDGTDPTSILPDAKTIIVLLEVYFSKSYPRSVEGNFGRCYLDDDRVTRDGLSRRIKAFRTFQLTGLLPFLPYLQAEPDKRLSPKRMPPERGSP